MQRELSQKHRDSWVPAFVRISELSRGDWSMFLDEVAKVLVRELSPAWEDKRDQIFQRISELSRDDRGMFLEELVKMFGSFASYEEPEQKPPAWKNEEAVWEFVASKIEGWRLIWEYPKPSPPSRTGRRGRPKISEELRRAKNPIHDAADQFYMIHEVLKEFYPHESRAVRRERALTFAAENNWPVRSTTLAEHLHRNRKNRRRVPLRYDYPN